MTSESHPHPAPPQSPSASIPPPPSSSSSSHTHPTLAKADRPAAAAATAAAAAAAAAATATATTTIIATTATTIATATNATHPTALSDQSSPTPNTTPSPTPSHSRTHSSSPPPPPSPAPSPPRHPITHSSATTTNTTATTSSAHSRRPSSKTAAASSAAPSTPTGTHPPALAIARPSPVEYRVPSSPSSRPTAVASSVAPVPVSTPSAATPAPTTLVPDLHLPSTQRAASYSDYPPQSTNSNLYNTSAIAASPTRTPNTYFGDQYYSPGHLNNNPSSNSQFLPQPQPTIAPPQHAPPPGLFNLGNTCYLNSVLQVLYHIPAFRTAILSWPGLPPTLQTEPLLFAADLVHALRMVFEALDRAQKRADSIYLERLRQQQPQPVQQNDVQKQQFAANTNSNETNDRTRLIQTPPFVHGFRSSSRLRHQQQQQLHQQALDMSLTGGTQPSLTDLQQGSLGLGLDVGAGLGMGLSSNNSNNLNLDLDLDEEDEDDDDWEGEDEDDDDDVDDDDEEEEEEEEEDDDTDSRLKPRKKKTSESSLFDDSGGLDDKTNKFNEIASGSRHDSRSQVDSNLQKSNTNNLQQSQDPTGNNSTGNSTNNNVGSSLIDADLREGMDYVEPQDMITLLRNEHRCLEFDARGQQDAHEFLRFLLDKVKDCVEALAEYEKEQEEARQEAERVEKERVEKQRLLREERERERERRRRDEEREREKQKKVRAAADHSHPDDDKERERKRLKTLSTRNGETSTTSTAEGDTGSGKSCKMGARDKEKGSEKTTREKEKIGVTTRRGAKLLEASVNKDSLSTKANSSSSNGSNRVGPRAKRRRCEMSMEREDAQNHSEEPTSNANGDSFTTKNDSNSKHAGEKDDLSDRMEDGCAKKGPGEERERIVDDTSKCKETTEQGSGKVEPEEDVKEEAESRSKLGLIGSLFGGKAVTMTRCEECEKVTQRWEDFLDISLPVKAEKSLAWALSSHGQAEQLCGDNKYMCDGCHTYCEAKRWLKLSALPKVLTVHLKLFAFEGGGLGGGVGSAGAGSMGAGANSGAKVSVAMPCPVRFKLSEWCSTDCLQRDDEYRLTGVIVHEGTGASSGHYYSFVLKFDEDGRSNGNGKGEGDGKGNSSRGAQLERHRAGDRNQGGNHHQDRDQEEQHIRGDAQAHSGAHAQPQGWWYCCDDSVVTAISEEEMTSMLFTSMRTRRTAYVLFYTHCLPDE